MADKIKELQDKIKMLREADPDSPKIADYERQLKSLVGGGSKSTASGNVLELEVNEAEWEEVKGGSNRPPAGEYLVEMQMPEIHYSDKACKLPFVIIQTGPWRGYEDAFYAARTGGVEKMFKLKQIAQACGIVPEINPSTGKLFLDFDKFPGKKFMAVYEIEDGVFTGTDGITRETHVPKVKKARAAGPQSLKI